MYTLLKAEFSTMKLFKVDALTYSSETSMNFMYEEEYS